MERELNLRSMRELGAGVHREDKRAIYVEGCWFSSSGVGGVGAIPINKRARQQAGFTLGASLALLRVMRLSLNRGIAFEAAE